MACEIHVDDLGTEFRVTIVNCDNAAIDISQASVRDIIIVKPSGTKMTKNLVPFFTDGTDGILNYTIIAGDLDEIGPHRIQGKITLAGGSWYSSTDNFDTVPNL